MALVKPLHSGDPDVMHNFHAATCILISMYTSHATEFSYTVKRARIICLMKMHPGSGPGTSSRKCSMTLIYFA